jgi:hypothetical protein
MLNHKMPLAMGLMLGLMAPWMLHSDAQAGFWFVLAHVAIIGGLSLLTLMIPNLRHRVANITRHHQPSPKHLLPLATTFALGWALTCAFCLMTGGQHWT